MARVLPENKKRSAYRKACPRHIVEFELAALKPKEPNVSQNTKKAEFQPVDRIQVVLSEEVDSLQMEQGKD